MQELGIESLSQLSLVHWLVGIAMYSIVTAGAMLAFARWLFRRQWAFYKNLKRSVLVLSPVDEEFTKMPDKELTIEITLLKKNGFLYIKDDITDYRSFDTSNHHGLVVIGYHEKMAGLDDLLVRIKSNSHIPLIVYTYGRNKDVISEAHQELFKSYPYTLYANFPITLLNQVFTTVASFPYKRD